MIVHRRGWLTLGVLGALAIAAACKDSNGPGGRVSGTYALRSINGSLPFTIGGGLGFQTQIVGGRIKVLDGRTLEDVFYVQSITTGGAPMGPQEVDSGVFAYRVSRDTMFIERPAPFPPDSWRDTAVMYGGDSITVWRRLAKINGFRPLTRGYVAYAKR